MAKMKQRGNTKDGQGWETMGTFIHCSEGRTGKLFGRLGVSDTVNSDLPWGPTNVLLRIHSRAIKIYVYTKT